MKNCLISFSFVLYACSFLVDGANILAIFPSPGYSQYFVAEPLLLHLAQRGHNITLVSFYKPKKPVQNIVPIEVEGLDAYHETKGKILWF